MEEKIERLNKAIRKNPNLSSEFKENFISLINLMVTNLPNYDYSYFENILSTLDIKEDDNVTDYSNYDESNNKLKLNKLSLLKDNVDIEHFILKKILSIGTHKEGKDKSLREFYDGMSSSMAGFIIGNEGW